MLQVLPLLCLQWKLKNEILAQAWREIWICLRIFPVYPAKEAADCKRVVCGGGRRWRLETVKPADASACSGHGVAIAPTVQSHQQAVPQDLLAWVFWKFQHVDTVEGVKAPWPTQQGNSSFFTKTTAAILITCMLGLKLSKKEMILCTFPSIYYIYM